jgi:hypothetical protein
MRLMFIGIPPSPTSRSLQAVRLEILGDFSFQHAFDGSGAGAWESVLRLGVTPADTPHMTHRIFGYQHISDLSS